MSCFRRPKRQRGFHGFGTHHTGGPKGRSRARPTCHARFGWGGVGEERPRSPPPDRAPLVKCELAQVTQRITL